MTIHLSQIYGDPSAQFPFSYIFQRRISEELTGLVGDCTGFERRFGLDWKPILRMSARRGTRRYELAGPALFRRQKDVEYVIFLPFDEIAGRPDAPIAAILALLEGALDVFERLGIEVRPGDFDHESIAARVCSDRSVLTPRHPWEPAALHETPMRRIFEDYFRRIIDRN